MYRVSFTGHRPQNLPYFGEDDPAFLDMMSRLSAEIDRLIADGAEEFYTGMARGVDTWAAELILEKKKSSPELRLIAVLPCPVQYKGWSRADIARYDAILAQCDRVMTISPRYTDDCMLKRDRALVELCDVLVAVYSGSSSGGTAYTVRYAQKNKRRVAAIKPIM